MSLPYIDQDTRDEIQRAADNGIDHEVIAGSIGISVAELCNLMAWPQWKSEPTKVAEPVVDLWRTHEVESQL